MDLTKYTLIHLASLGSNNTLECYYSCPNAPLPLYSNLEVSLY